MLVLCLVVDDEPLAQDVLLHYLQQLDDVHVIGVCSNLMEVETALEKHPDIDVIFMDVELPGYTAQDWFLINESLPCPVCIVLTTAYPLALLDEQLKQNAFAILHKPIRFENFKAVLEEILVLKKKSSRYSKERD